MKNSTVLKKVQTRYVGKSQYISGFSTNDYHNIIVVNLILFYKCTDHTFNMYRLNSNNVDDKVTRYLSFIIIFENK